METRRERGRDGIRGIKDREEGDEEGLQRWERGQSGIGSYLK